MDLVDDDRGRGAGKSTLVNALRLALDRADEALTGDFERFNKVGARDTDGALTDTTWLIVDYRRDDHPLRAAWSSDAAAAPLQEPVDDRTWKTVQGNVSQRTPVHIIGQGELAELAADATRLLSLVDDTPAVDRRSWQAEWAAEHARLLSLRARAREQRSRIPDRSQLLGEQTDLLRAIEVLERDEHRETLRAYQRVSHQEAALAGWQRSIEKSITRLREAIEDAPIDDPPLTQLTVTTARTRSCVPSSRSGPSLVVRPWRTPGRRSKPLRRSPTTSKLAPSRQSGRLTGTRSGRHMRRCRTSWRVPARIRRATATS